VAAADDWVARTAAQVRTEGERRHPGEVPTCASGISPSGPVHLGNLRELMTPHLVADEVRRNGTPCRHILSWDDYDRLRRVPAGLPGSLAEYIGRPLTAVPDPCDLHDNFAEHFKQPLRDSLDLLGVQVTEISQTEMYTSGAYTAQIVLAMRRRADIGVVLGQYRTRRPKSDSDADEEDEPQAGEYYPFRPYCASCGRDDTTVTGFDDETTEITYTCACGAVVGPTPIADVAGKLAWKVDWPMRWAYEHVTFEPAGADHASPGSSFTVGGELVTTIFGGEMPLHFGYAFVGTSGSSKMSGSRGGAPTPADALEIFEAPLLRWLYARRRPEQSITLAFGAEVGRIYDEWDTLSTRVAEGDADDATFAVYTRASSTSDGPLPVTPRPLRFSTLASVADITAGDQAQMLRIVRDLTVDDPVRTLDEVRPRLDCAQAWVTGYVPLQDRTQVRDQPDYDALAALTESERDAIKLLINGMADDWSLEGLTTLLYGIPKLQRGLPISAPPTQELKTSQRAWFILLYQLLIGKDTGPRLPTLLLALGPDRVRSLLVPG
jgi:lysyl-tRNA synthetase, class I